MVLKFFTIKWNVCSNNAEMDVAVVGNVTAIIMDT